MRAKAATERRKRGRGGEGGASWGPNAVGATAPLNAAFAATAKHRWACAGPTRTRDAGTTRNGRRSAGGAAGPGTDGRLPATGEAETPFSLSSGGRVRAKAGGGGGATKTEKRKGRERGKGGIMNERMSE